MVILNGHEIQLNHALPKVNVLRLLEQMRRGLNVLLATREDEQVWVDLLWKVVSHLSGDLPGLRLAGMVPVPVLNSLLLTHGNVPVLGVEKDLLLSVANDRKSGKPILLHLAFVASSKGGMGKSTFCVLLANRWSSQGVAKVVDQDANSTLGVVLHNLVSGESGSRLRLQKQGDLFLRTHPSGELAQIYICPPSRPETDQGPHSQDFMLDLMLVAEVLLPGNRLIIDLPGDVGVASNRIAALRDVLDSVGARLSGLDIYLFVQPQSELMDQAVHAIQTFADRIQDLAGFLDKSVDSTSGPSRPRMVVLYPHTSSKEDVRKANQHLSKQSDLQRLAGHMDIRLAVTPMPQVPNQWEYWQNVFSDAVKSLRVDSIQTVPIQSVSAGR